MVPEEDDSNDLFQDKNNNKEYSWCKKHVVRCIQGSSKQCHEPQAVISKDQPCDADQVKYIE